MEQSGFEDNAITVKIEVDIAEDKHHQPNDGSNKCHLSKTKPSALYDASAFHFVKKEPDSDEDNLENCRTYTKKEECQIRQNRNSNYAFEKKQKTEECVFEIKFENDPFTESKSDIDDKYVYAYRESDNHNSMVNKMPHPPECDIDAETTQMHSSWYQSGLYKTSNYTQNSTKDLDITDIKPKAICLSSGKNKDKVSKRNLDIRTNNCALKKKQSKNKLVLYRTPICKKTIVDNLLQPEKQELIDTKSNALQNGSLTVASTSNIYCCSKCGKSFPQLCRLKRHELTHDDKRAFSCKFCGAEFKMRSHLKQHCLQHTGIRKFECDQCDSKFFRLDHLKAHKLTHLGLRPHSCHVCCLTFTQAVHLKKHLLRHRDDRIVYCKIKTCRAVFNSVQELKRHRETHAEDSTCKLCGVVLSRADDLKKHMLIHTKIKPYSCDVCLAKFTQVGHLNTHKLKHSDERRFSCTLCGFSSKQACHLKRHMAVHNGNRKFACGDCGASFLRSSNLTRHIRQCRAPKMTELEAL